MSQTDVITALRSNLRSNAELSALVSGRVWGGQVPQSENILMPRAAVLLRYAGLASIGSGQSYLQVSYQRIDTFCYGETPKIASDVFRVVYQALKQMRRNVQGKTVVHWAIPGGGPLSGTEPDTEWFVVTGSWQVMFSDQETP